MMDLIDEKIQYDHIKWQQVQDKLYKRFGRIPDLQTITYLIGHRELGQNRIEFTKEEKEELMHVGVCTLLAQRDMYRFDYLDQDGWPHYQKNPNVPHFDGKEQEDLLKAMIIEYFERMQ